MRTCFQMARAASLVALSFALILVFSINAPAQTSRTKNHQKPTTAAAPSLEKKFFVNILRDQRAIWTSPFHLHGTDAKWLAPLGLSTGPGIAAAARDQVFDRFFRVDKARSRDESTNGSGAGLGLAIAKWVVELHGGSIGLDRPDHGGATFVISLPNSIVS